MNKCAIFILLSLFYSATSFAQPGKAQDDHNDLRFSPRGLKASLSSLSVGMTDERNVDDGEGAALSLGYGFTDRFTLWLTLLGSEHNSKATGASQMYFGGLELSVQHKFQTDTRWQPYGRIGGGVYSLRNKGTDVELIGAGLTIGLGVDFFFSKHVGVGAELSFKKLDYFEERTPEAGGDFLKELNPDLNGDAGAFMLTLTLQ